MRAGKLDREITLERYSLTYNEDNEPIEGWSVLATVSASWRRASATETLASAQISATATDVFECRYSDELSELTSIDRLTYDGHTYNIASVSEVGRRRALLIEATRQAD